MKTEGPRLVGKPDLVAKHIYYQERVANMNRNTLQLLALVALTLSFAVNMGFAQGAGTNINAFGTVLAPLGVSGDGSELW